MKIAEILAPGPLFEYNPGEMRTYWHVTPDTRLKSIMAQGIVPSRRRQWKNYMGARLGETKMVYLFSNFDSAIQFAAKLEWGLKSEKRRNTKVDILELQTDAPVAPDDNIEGQLDGRGGTWWKTSRPIPPQSIVKVIPLTLQMTRDFIARRDGRMPASPVDQPAETQPVQPVVQGQRDPNEQ